MRAFTNRLTLSLLGLTLSTVASTTNAAPIHPPYTPKALVAREDFDINKLNTNFGQALTPCSHLQPWPEHGGVGPSCNPN
ncbi:MAG: hypothetical protein JOS17DRAFT_728442 [Linnemannia elongata]|nr:MAG: hypothetical protein JOS17DRAFT_728442 [Linnemannia elongata]